MAQNSIQVVIQTAFLGDLFLSIPFLKRLRENFPQDQIALICKKGQGDYFKKMQLADLVFEVKKGDRNNYLRVVKDLNSKKVKNLFCIHRSTRSQLMSWQIRAEKKYGFKSFLGRWIFDQTVDYPRSWPDPIRQLALLSLVDSSLREILKKDNWAYLNENSVEGTLQRIPLEFVSGYPMANRPKTKRVALFPGSVWATKKWKLSGFTEVTKRLVQAGYEVNLLGGPDEKFLCEEIKKSVPEAILLAGSKSIDESVQFIGACDLVLCNDSAPAHMAAAQDIPVVAIFGPTTLALGFRPWLSKAIVVENRSLNCRPCGKHGHQKCPLDHHLCMNDISTDQVFNACHLLLTR